MSTAETAFLVKWARTVKVATHRPQRPYRHIVAASSRGLGVGLDAAPNARRGGGRQQGDSKENECAAILGRFDLEGALVAIDAIATNPSVAETITAAGDDYLLALKRNRPTLHDDVARYFDDRAFARLPGCERIDKDHGRIENRRIWVTHEVDRLASGRRYPDKPRFHALDCLVKTTTRSE